MTDAERREELRVKIKPLTDQEREWGIGLEAEASRILRDGDAQLIHALRQRVAELEEWNLRLQQALDAKGFIFHRDGRAATIVDGAGEFTIEAIATMVEERDELKLELDRLHSQLPDGMGHCTIVFQKCANGHGWLTATNWVQHGCSTCERDQLKAENAEYWRAVMALENADSAEKGVKAINDLHDIRTGNSYSSWGPPVAEWLAKQLEVAEAEYKKLRTALGMLSDDLLIEIGMTDIVASRNKVTT